jgi:hypothetical protein
MIREGVAFLIGYIHTHHPPDGIRRLLRRLALRVGHVVCWPCRVDGGKKPKPKKVERTAEVVWSGPCSLALAL